MSVDIKAPRNKISTTGSDTVTGTTLNKYINASIASVDAVSGVTTKYNINTAEDVANIHKNLSVEVSGCTNAANNGTFVVVDVSDVLGDKYIVLGNGSGVEELSSPEAAVCQLDLTLHAMHVMPLTDSETEFEVDMSLSGEAVSGRVTVTDTATKIPGASIEGRKTFMIFNASLFSIDIGWSNTITFGNHMVLIPGAALTLDVTNELTLYGIADTAVTAEICYMEVS